jgi:hypothetical protein
MGNIAIQTSWSRGRSEAVESGAHKSVGHCMAWVTGRGLKFDNILAIGPQHGFELDAMIRFGAKTVIGVDIVPEFCEDCRERGHQCLEGEAEELTTLLPGEKWNVYTSHSMEHFVDAGRAAKEITGLLDQWCYVTLPIEPDGASNPSHLSSPGSESDVLDWFGGLTMSLRECFRLGRPRFTARYLFTK